MSIWHQVAIVEDIPPQGSRVVNTRHGDIALFRTAENEVFALLDRCPHKGGPLSQGIVFGRKVACPLHNWHINLEHGNATAPDIGCAQTFPVRVDDGMVYLALD
ncbi:MAG: nitrite reductase small subunit NirD [Pseudomonadota bacterium]